MSTQDNRLIPVGLDRDRGIDRPLSDLIQSKPYGVTGADAGTLKDYLFVILKRKWLILSLVLVVTSLVAIQSFRAPAIYEGETTIRIQQKTPNILQTDKLVIGGQSDPNFWGTQLKLLQNPTLARQVVLILDLPHNPSFFGGHRKTDSSIHCGDSFRHNRQRQSRAPSRILCQLQLKPRQRWAG